MLLGHLVIFFCEGPVQVFCPEFVCFKLSMLYLSTYLSFLCISFFPRVFYFYLGLLSFILLSVFFGSAGLLVTNSISICLKTSLYCLQFEQYFVGYWILVWQLFFQYFKDGLPLSSSFEYRFSCCSIKGNVSFSQTVFTMFLSLCFGTLTKKWLVVVWGGRGGVVSLLCT